jgi:guanylate kinase
MVYEDYKGIPRCQIEDALKSGQDVILRVDVQGAATLRRLYPEAVLIFLIPQNEEEWLNRLQQRRSESPESLKIRVDKATEEIAQLKKFNYIVVNADACLSNAVEDILHIIEVEHMRTIPRKILK